MPPHASSTRSSADGPSTSTRTATVPSGGVCRIALDSRLRTTRANSGSDPSTTGHVAASARSTTPLREATAASAATTPLTTSASGTSESVSRSAPAVIRDSSNRSSTIPDNASASAEIRPA
ncbi:hypothetical protein GCM10018963_18960 [Saccharothrix longispora]